MYQCFNFLLDSNIALPELPEYKSGTPELRFRIEERLSGNNSLEWYHHWYYPEGETYLSSARITDGYFLRFAELADFKINTNENTIYCYPFNGTDIDTIRHLFLDQVIPRYVSLSGYIILHASAVVINNKLILFLGETGAGKSTIAATFSDDDTKILTDDCVMLVQSDCGYVGVPNYAGLRLWSDSYEATKHNLSRFTALNSSEKKKLVPEIKAEEPNKNMIPVGAIFELKAPSSISGNREIRIQKISGANQLITLLKHTFTLAIQDKDTVRQNFLNNCHVASANISMHYMQYPHDFSYLDNVRIAIQNLINSNT